MSPVELVLASGVAVTAPVLWAALGELISEQSGTLNVGIEGVMVIAAFVAALVFQRTGDALVAVLAAALGGAACGLLLSLLYVRLGTDQIITGIVFTAVALGLATVLTEQLLGRARTASLPDLEVPLLGAIPALGPILFDHNALVYGALLAVPCVAYLMRRTWFGLHLRAAGERPLVVETAGLPVRGLRAVALTLGCTLVGVGGATLILSTASTFQPGVTGGRGYVALAVVVLARWNPFAAVPGAFLFGVAQAFQFQAAHLPLLSALPHDVVLMAPYVVALVAVVAIRGSKYPAAVGAPFRPLGAARTA